MDGAQSPHSGRCAFFASSERAPAELMQKALYFPNIVGTRLQDGETAHTTDICSGKVSVVSMLSSKISEVREDVPTSFATLIMIAAPCHVLCCGGQQAVQLASGISIRAGQPAGERAQVIPRDALSVFPSQCCSPALTPDISRVAPKYGMLVCTRLANLD